MWRSRNGDQCLHIEVGWEERGRVSGENGSLSHLEKIKEDGKLEVRGKAE